jgi:ABC-type polysaccharide/polyol phosphate transport system ATPase subunit
VTSPEETAISIRGVGKRFTKYEDSPMLVTAALKFRSRTKRSKLWAVRGVNVDVSRGECIGVIGRNGSGKSTLLQMLAGVTAPTEGRVSVTGRVAPLISVGVGFHQELTGRENVYLNGTILGLTRSQIDRKFDEIVEFAEIASFVDTPVKFFSSGMFVRLGFAVAVQAEPDVLLVDEVLAVGDMAFQMKCYDKMTEIRHSGATIAVVSHNLNAVRNMCDRTMVLHYGEQRFLGSTDEAISLYHTLLDEPREPEAEEPGTVRTRKGVINIESLELLGPDGKPTSNVEYGDEVTFRVDLSVHEDVEDPILGFVIQTVTGVPVYIDSSYPPALGRFRAGDHAVIDVRLKLPLVTGSYNVSVGVQLLDSTHFDEHPGRMFYVSGRHRMLHGFADLAAAFEVSRVSGGQGSTESDGAG